MLIEKSNKNRTIVEPRYIVAVRLNIVAVRLNIVAVRLKVLSLLVSSVSRPKYAISVG